MRLYGNTPGLSYEHTERDNGWRAGVARRSSQGPVLGRKGVFSGLYRHVESLATAAPGVIGLRLYVEENNKRAQQTYEALGMIKPSYLVMERLLDSETTDTTGEN